MNIKFARFISLILLGLFVYWAAAYDTFYNFLNTLLEDLQPWAKTTIDKINEVLRNMTDQDIIAFGSAVGTGLFVVSCVALGLSLLYLVVLRKTAKQRNTYGEIKTYVCLSAACIALTAFNQDGLYWWTLPVVPIASYVLCYALLYLPYYRYLRWVFALFFDLLVIAGFGIFYTCSTLYGVGDTDESLVRSGMIILISIFSAWFVLKRRKRYSCEECKKYVDDIYVGRTIDSTTISYHDFDTDVATGYKTTTTYDKYGHKVGESSVATGWRRSKGTTKKIVKLYSDLYRCPCCGYEHSTQDSTETKKPLGYKQREEAPGEYKGDLPNA